MPNTLMQMQELKNAPWGQGTNMTRTQYVTKIKAIDAATQYDPDMETANVEKLDTNKLMQTAEPNDSEIVFHDFDYVGYEGSYLDANVNTVDQEYGQQSRNLSTRKKYIGLSSRD